MKRIMKYDFEYFIFLKNIWKSCSLYGVTVVLAVSLFPDPLELNLLFGAFHCSNNLNVFVKLLKFQLSTEEDRAETFLGRESKSLWVWHDSKTVGYGDWEESHPDLSVSWTKLPIIRCATKVSQLLMKTPLYCDKWLQMNHSKIYIAREKFSRSILQRSNSIMVEMFMFWGYPRIKSSHSEISSYEWNCLIARPWTIDWKKE